MPPLAFRGRDAEAADQLLYQRALTILIVAHAMISEDTMTARVSRCPGANRCLGILAALIDGGHRLGQGDLHRQRDGISGGARRFARRLRVRHFYFWVADTRRARGFYTPRMAAAHGQRALEACRYAKREYFRRRAQASADDNGHAKCQPGHVIWALDIR